MSSRQIRRLVGMLRARLPDARLERTTDPRQRRKTKWAIGTLLRTVVVGMTAGCKSLADVENLSAFLPSAARRALGIARRLPDTTARDLLCKLDPISLRERLVDSIRAAHRRKALQRIDGLPFGVVAIDGKCTAIGTADGDYAQRQRKPEHGLRGLVRTQTVSLISDRASPCLDARPIEAETNEAGSLPALIDDLVETYADPLDLFRLVITDAGPCSLANAAHIRSRGLHYAMRLTDAQPTLFEEAKRLLCFASAPAPHTFTDQRSDGEVVYDVQVDGEMAAFHGWDHLRSVIRVVRTFIPHDGSKPQSGERFWLSSLPPDRLDAARWLTLMRRYWRVENCCHHTFDVAFQEDNRPWIDLDSTGMLAILLLRRIAYNILALYRCRTQRSDARRAIGWRTLMAELYAALLRACSHHVNGLRRRAPWQLSLD